MESVPYRSFMTGLTKRHPIVVSYTALVRGNATSALGMAKGARDMLSTPPAITSWLSPARMARAATATASMPDPTPDPRPQGDPPVPVAESVSDRSLLRRFRQGQPDAPTELYLRYAREALVAV